MPSDAGYRTSEGNPRKRQKLSRSDRRAAAPASASNSDVKDNTMAPPAVIAIPDSDPSPVVETKAEKQPCEHEASLRALQGDLDAMRELITCNVCQRFLYEPFSLACGHTYCYSCLDRWVATNHKKTCPDCRSDIKQEPTQAFTIREMVLIFISKAQLLPDGETLEEHDQFAKEEAEILAKDKANDDPRKGGLFKGAFRRHAPLNTRYPGQPLIAIHDHEDNVDRCPECHHEVEDGLCSGCNERVYRDYAEADEDDADFSESDIFSGDEDDHDLEEEDFEDENELERAMREADGFYGDNDDDDSDGTATSDVWDLGEGPPDTPTARPTFPRRRHGRGLLAGLPIGQGRFVSDDDDETDDSEEDDEHLHDEAMEGFIDDNDDYWGLRNAAGHVDYESGRERDLRQDSPGSVASRAITLESDDDISDDTDGTAVRPVARRPALARRRARRRRPIALDSEDEDEDEDAEESNDEALQARENGVPVQDVDGEGFSSMEDESSVTDDNDDDDDEDDDSMGSETGGSEAEDSDSTARYDEE